MIGRFRPGIYIHTHGCILPNKVEHHRRTKMKWIIISLIACFGIDSSSAQLSTDETLVEFTKCHGFDSIDLACSADEIIAYESLRYFYDFVRCATECCTYDAGDSVISGSTADTEQIRRFCSGRSSCNLNLDPSRDFGDGLKDTSYIVLGYYCIASSRITSICSDTTIPSNGLPLYLTSDNYPQVETDGTSCSCSLEVQSCSSDVILYTIDADLYLDTTTCHQNLKFMSGTNTTLTSINCEDYYPSAIQHETLNSHYVYIDFINNNVANLEGLFFVSLEASDSSASFTLSCSSEVETWCVECGSLPTISKGSISLSDVTNSSYGSLADVTCNPGYETNTSTVTCQGNGTWSSATCTEIVCGSLPTISKGSISLSDVNNSSYGSLADVTCDSGYETNTPTVTCQGDGTWSSATCTAIVCGSLPTISKGSISLNDVNNSSYGSLADVTCDPGYETNTPTVTCQEDGTWSSVSCTEIAEIECDPSPTIDHGTISVDHHTIGYKANVTCADGYETNKPSISCQTSGLWETSTCITEADAGGSTGNDDTSLVLVLIIVFIGGIFVIQLVLITLFSCKGSLHDIRHTANEKSSTAGPILVFVIVASFFPVIGCLAIGIIIWKVYTSGDEKQSSNGNACGSDIQLEQVNGPIKNTV